MSLIVLSPQGVNVMSQPDDTQVMTTQEMEDQSKSSRICQSVSADPILDQDNDPHTYETGDTGHIKLFDDDTQHLGTMGFHETGDSQGTLGGVTQIDMEPAITSPARFPVESFAGSKRDSRGHIVSPQPRTPMGAIAAAFNMKDDAAGLPSMAEIFNQTQANFSPSATAIHSDCILERPSPEFAAPSSPKHRALSSPVRSNRDQPRATTEPRNVYVSVRQSQELRSRRQSTHEQSSSPPPELEEDDDELGENSMEKKLRLRRQKAQMQEEAMKQFASLGSSNSKRSVNGLRGHGRSRSEVINLITPTTAKPRRKRIFISDDHIRGEEEDLADGAVSSDDEMQDEFDELSQAVLTSDRPDEDMLGPTPDRRFGGAKASLVRSASSPMQRQMLHNQHDAHVRNTFQLSTTQQPGYPHSQPRIAVANSQPEFDSLTARPPRPMQPSSVDSRGLISESQCIGLTLSSAKQYESVQIPPESILSSVPPAPHLSSQTSRISKDNDDDHHHKANSPDSSPPPQFPLITKDENVQAANEQEGAIDDTAEEDPDQLDHLAQHFVTSPQSESSAHAATDSIPARLSNRMRHQIPESSPMRSSAGRAENDMDQSVDQDATTASSAVVTGMEAVDGPNSRSEKATATDKSNSDSRFATARTHQPTLDEEHSRQAAPALPTSNNLNMTAIAMQASPEQSSNDVDTSRFNIMDDDDLAFNAILNGDSEPPRKRQRVTTYTRRTINTSPEHPQMPQPRSSPPVRKSVRLAPNTPASPERTSPTSARANGTGKLKHVKMRQGKALSPAKHINKLDDDEPGASIFEVNETPQTDPSNDGPTMAAAEGQADDPLQSDMPGDAMDVDIEVVDEDPAPARRVSEEQELIIPDPVSTPNPQEHRAPDRVLARFNGTKMAFYPATCLGPVKPGSSVFRVRFDDGSVTEVEAHLVRRLELLPGENVRVDLPEMRTRTWAVKGFLDRVEEALAANHENTQTDIRGFKTVRLEARQRKSLPATGEIPEAETMDVAITNIYLTLQMWNQLKGRGYKHPQAIIPTNRLTTPYNSIATPATPASRTRRKTMSELLPPSRTISLASEAQNGLFSNMAFAITYPSDKDSYRNRVSRLILSNGGVILSDGFDELFEPTTSLPPSPSKSPASTTTLSSQPLSLNFEAKKLGFTALIADAHCRKAKYMQALALNIPCISGRWIVDCISQERVLPWDRYLLPAGESSFLQGAIRSRTFTRAQTNVNEPSSAKLVDVVEQRNKLAEGKNVILVTGTSKLSEDRRKPYLFLMSALGANKIDRVRDIGAAKALLQRSQGGYDWVYVEDAKVGKVEERLGLDGKSAGSNARKRKRGLEEERGTPLSDAGGIRVINDEFVVQSLILGALVEDV